MRRTLEIRAKAFAMVGAASYQTYRDLHDRYLTKLEAAVPAGMRTPTVNEIRRFDRNKHGDIGGRHQVPLGARGAVCVETHRPGDCHVA